MSQRREISKAAKEIMMIEKGLNTYITIQEADELIHSLFALDSSIAYWDALTGGQKETFLLSSCNEIETAPKQGCKVWGNSFRQPLEFPRRADFWRPLNYLEVPVEVKQAQAVNAVAIMKIQLDAGQKDGLRLSSAKAEKLMWRWFCGGM